MRKSIAIMLLSVVFLTSCAAKDGDTVMSPVQSSVPVSTPTSTPEPTPEPTPEQQNKIGDTVMLGGWEIGLLGCEIASTIGSGQDIIFKADEGNKYVVVALTIKNIGTADDVFLPSSSEEDDVHVKLLYQSDYEFLTVDLSEYPDELHDKSLDPSGVVEGVIAFEIAEDVAVSDELILVLSKELDHVEYELRGAIIAAEIDEEPTPSPTVVPELTPEPSVISETQTTQNSGELPINFTEWVPYSTSSLEQLAKNIENGNVIYYNGQYWASPEYANAIANETIVYEHDISEDAGTSNRFSILDVDLSDFFDEETEQAEQWDLDGIY